MVEGTGEVWVRNPMATYWKKVKVVITRDGSWTLIIPRDQKRLLLLQQNYPTFLGTGKYRRSNTRTTQRYGASSDSGISGSESEDSDTEEEDTANTVGSQDNEGEFSGPLPSNEVEIRYDGNSIEIELGSDISDGDMAAEA